MRDILITDMLSFIRLGKLVKPNIEIYQRDRTRPAVQLPEHIREFLGASLRKSLTEVSWYWYAFMDAIWSEGEVQATEEEVAIFHEHGLSRMIGEWFYQWLMFRIHSPQVTGICSLLLESAFALSARTIEWRGTS